jgi:hypothetical protein
LVSHSYQGLYALSGFFHLTDGFMPCSFNI